MVTQAQLRTISESKTPKPALVEALAVVLADYKPHVQAHILAQVMHESGGLVFDREVWGPTAAQKGYEGRKDLGNTTKGDGSKYRGYGPIQVTGRANTTAFHTWCTRRGLNPPDFIAKPELIATSPWAGWSVVWYWEAGNPTRKSLSRYADANDIEMITRRVNGGLNGYEDRLHYYDRAALVLLGYAPTNIKGFQRAAKLTADGISGPQTRAAMHLRLVGKTDGEINRVEVKASPVVETVTTTEAVAVTAPSADAPWWKSKETIVPLIAGGGLTGASGAMSDFGRIPFANLALIIVAVCVIAAGVLYALKKKDKKIVAAQVATIQQKVT